MTTKIVVKKMKLKIPKNLMRFLLFFTMLPAFMHVLSFALVHFIIIGKLNVILICDFKNNNLNNGFRKMRWILIKTRINKYFVVKNLLVIDQ